MRLVRTLQILTVATLGVIVSCGENEPGGDSSGGSGGDEWMAGGSGGNRTGGAGGSRTGGAGGSRTGGAGGSQNGGAGGSQNGGAGGSQNSGAGGSQNSGAGGSQNGGAGGSQSGGAGGIADGGSDSAPGMGGAMDAAAGTGGTSYDAGVVDAAIDAPINPTPLNLAWGKIVTASSEQPDPFPEQSPLLASYAVDGNLRTRWGSVLPPASEEWFMVDLGEITTIARVHIFWETAFAAAYRIEISTDGQNWSLAATITDATGGETDHPFSPVEARYVRVTMYERATQWGYSFYELQVFAPDGSYVDAAVPEPDADLPDAYDAAIPESDAE